MFLFFFSGMISYFIFQGKKIDDDGLLIYINKLIKSILVSFLFFDGFEKQGIYVFYYCYVFD